MNRSRFQRRAHHSALFCSSPLTFYSRQVYTIYRLKNMGWGKRFYETTYGDGQRTRRCWGCGPGATEAAMRVQDEKNARAEDIALVRSYQLRDKQIEP
jgi:hypothetical protein